jgi:RNA-directed DNA polymerase
LIKGLLGIQHNIEKARLDGKVQNLATYINKNTLLESHKEMDRKKAKGIDGVAKDDYTVHLEANVEHLVKRMKSGSYKPEPIRRVYIPKDGSDKMRPLGISCYEDKLVENVIAQILTMVYEPKFYLILFFIDLHPPSRRT